EACCVLDEELSAFIRKIGQLYRRSGSSASSKEKCLLSLHSFTVLGQSISNLLRDFTCNNGKQTAAAVAAMYKENVQTGATENQTSPLRPLSPRLFSLVSVVGGKANFDDNGGDRS